MQKYKTMTLKYETYSTLEKLARTENRTVPNYLETYFCKHDID